MAAQMHSHPINAKASTALKAAALHLIRENGYDKVSIAAIAKEAGVARQTLYNRWDTKADLVLEAVFEETHSYAADPILGEAKDCRTMLEEFLSNVFDHLNLDGDTLRALISAAQQDATFQGSFSANFVLPRERMITAMIHGAFWYCLLNRGALDAKLARDIASEIFDRSIHQ